jgi:hypothetical protein
MHSKRYRSLQLHCYPQIPLLGIEHYLGFGPVDSLYPGGCWGSMLATTQPFENCQQEGKAGVGFLQF